MNKKELSKYFSELGKKSWKARQKKYGEEGGLGKAREKRWEKEVEESYPQNGFDN